MMQEDNHIFQGLRRDNHQIRQDAKFLWDAHNIRLTNRDDSTLLSITNERGTLFTGVELDDYYVGHCVVGKYLVVFTATEDDGESHIYRIEKTNTGYDTQVLYEGYLGLSSNHPIETIGVYENDFTQKVYWVDGLNQPRVINIMNVGKFYNSESFDFIQTLTLEEKVRIEQLYGEGMFAPGAIQYAFTYYNKYGQETNIFYTTPLYYISHLNRGGSPDEKVSNSFRIKLDNLDISNFEYVRVYSIHRTSIDSVPTVKRVSDIHITRELVDTNDGVVYIDKGTSGEIVDSTLLLYIGGKDIVASTMCAKDGTLFLGGIELKGDKDWVEVKNKVIQSIDEEHWRQVIYNTRQQDDIIGKYYAYTIAPDITGFKSNETYRCGIQFQSKIGSWSEPIFIKDGILNYERPYTKDRLNNKYGATVSSRNIKNYKGLQKQTQQGNNNPIYWESQEIQLDQALVEYLKEKGYVKARTCVVFPSNLDRTILCQGVLCPTVYGINNRANQAPYAQSSWFFRPQGLIASDRGHEHYGSFITWQHHSAVGCGGSRGAEIQSAPDLNMDWDVFDRINVDPDEFSSRFCIDANIVTMHSPDIEFGDFSNVELEGTSIDIIGDVSMSSVIGDIDIQTEGKSTDNFNRGFIHKTLGYPGINSSVPIANGGLVAGLFFSGRDKNVTNISDPDSTYPQIYYMVYPFQREGPLNGDKRGSNEANLKRKRMSNLKFFDNFSIVPDNALHYNITTPQLFNSNEVSLVKVKLGYLDKEAIYYGNIDTILAPPRDGFNNYGSSTFFGQVSTHSSIKHNDGVRMRYKSSPHLVFSLKSSNIYHAKPIEILPLKEPALIPTGSSVGVTNGYSTMIPPWDNIIQGSESKSSIKEVLDNLPNLSIIDNGEVESVDKYWTVSFSSSTVKGYKYAYLNKSTTNKGRFLQYIPDKIGIQWDYAEAHKSIKEGDILKMVGDGHSSATVTPYPDDRVGLDEKYYTGVTKYFKVTNVRKSLSSDTESWIAGDLKELTYEEVIADIFGDNYTSEEETPSTNPKEGFTISQALYRDYSIYHNPYLLVAELKRNNVTNRFGGTSDAALKENLWIPSSDPISLYEDIGIEGEVSVPFKYGDTWFARYDCLKTYPYSEDDINGIVEIGSFMCETRVNIDGRYDRNRGQLSNLNMSHVNFNLMNEVYSQKNNYFGYRIFDEDYYKQSKFQNQVTWSLEKINSSDTDQWTNITLANTLDFNGTNGNITKIEAWQEYLMCFQEKALNQIMFNSRTQIPTQDGVPIEISNSHKVDGTRVFNNIIGCNNKWSISNTPIGIYFIDSNTNDIYLFNGQLSNLSKENGMSWWVKYYNPDIVWKSVMSNNSPNGIRTFYDERYGDVYFTPGPSYIGDSPDSLCFSEKLGQFTSFMSYGGIPAMFNFSNGFYSLKPVDNTLKLYENNSGKYNDFYGEFKGWDFSFISNQNPTVTKVFDTIELRADHYSSSESTNPELGSCPVNFIDMDNEYQHSDNPDDNDDRVRYSMKSKFRIWRGLLPRNWGTRQRFRNPWSMVTLGFKRLKDTSPEELTNKAIVHDVTVKYTI